MEPEMRTAGLEAAAQIEPRGEPFPGAASIKEIRESKHPRTSHTDLVEIKLEANGRGNFRCLAICVSIVSFAVVLIAIICALFGAWLVLPFAGLEVALLALGTWLCCMQARHCDSLVFSDSYIHLTQYRHSRQAVHSFVRRWTHVAMRPGGTRHEPTQLLIGSHGRFFLIGEYLTECNRLHVYEQLNKRVRLDV